MWSLWGWVLGQKSHYPIGLERTWSDSSARQNKTPRSSNGIKLLTANLTYLRPFSLWECKIPLQTVIADHLDRMQIASSHLSRHHRGALSESSLVVFHSILDYPGIEEKRWGLETLWRPMSSDCDLAGSHQGAPKAQGLNPRMSRTLNNKPAHLSLYHGGKQFRYHQFISSNEEPHLEDGSIFSLLLFWCLYVEIIFFLKNKWS